MLRSPMLIFLTIVLAVTYWEYAQYVKLPLFRTPSSDVSGACLVS
jgi:hypothetical protein